MSDVSEQSPAASSDAQHSAAQAPPAVPPAPVFMTGPPPKQQGFFRRGFGLGAGAGLGVGLILLVLGVVGSLVSALIFGAAVAATSAQSGPQVAGLDTVWGHLAHGVDLRLRDRPHPGRRRT